MHFTNFFFIRSVLLYLAGKRGNSTRIDYHSHQPSATNETTNQVPKHISSIVHNAIDDIKKKTGFVLILVVVDIVSR